LIQKIQLTTIKEVDGDKVLFSFCPMTEEILIADKSFYKSETSSDGEEIKRYKDKRVYSFPYKKNSTFGQPLHTKIEIKNVYTYESIFFHETETSDESSHYIKISAATTWSMVSKFWLRTKSTPKT
jgi:AAA+ ATPase superfamily predicted ATPase